MMLIISKSRHAMGARNGLGGLIYALDLLLMVGQFRETLLYAIAGESVCHKVPCQQFLRDETVRIEEYRIGRWIHI